MTFDFQRSKYSLRGRGSASNPANRFDSQQVEAFDDGWHAPVEDKPVLKTEISEESPRSFITYNRSPDCHLIVRSIRTRAVNMVVFIALRDRHMRFWAFRRGLILKRG